MRLQVIPDPSRLKQWVAYRVQDVCWDEEKDRIGYEGTNQSGRQTLNGVQWGRRGIAANRDSGTTLALVRTEALHAESRGGVHRSTEV